MHFLAGLPEQPNSIPIDHREGARELLSVLGSRRHNNPGLVRRFEAMEADQQHPMMGPTLAIHQLPEVFVYGHHDSLLLRCRSQYLIIRYAWTRFSDVRYLVARTTECVDDRSIYSLVAEELQRV